MEDHQGDFKLIMVIQFNNRKEDWMEFALMFIAIADERGYDEILEGTVNVPRETDVPSPSHQGFNDSSTTSIQSKD